MTEAALYVGIDVSNASLDVSFLNADARTVRPPSTYANDPEGWTVLRAAVIAASRLVGEHPRVVCGMESTSNMHKGIEHALRKESRRSIEVHVLNPRAVKHFGVALLKSAKTDRLDSHLIALFLLRMQPEPTAEMPDLYGKGELDIIARDGEILVFVEVKSRFNLEFGPPELGITKKKQSQVRRIAEAYLHERDIIDTDCRIDVVAILFRGKEPPQINHILNAF